MVFRRGVWVWSSQLGGRQWGTPFGHLAGPAAFAVLTVVKSADESEIVQVGAATVDPRGDVVGFAPIRGAGHNPGKNSRHPGRRGPGVARGLAVRRVSP